MGELGACRKGNGSKMGVILLPTFLGAVFGVVGLNSISLAAQGVPANLAKNAPPKAPVDSGAARSTPMTAFEDPYYDTCGFNCNYHKANEVISLTADYLLKKYQFLNGDHSRAEKYALLGSYCTNSEWEGRDDEDDEGLDVCIERYEDMYRLWTRRARGAIVKNETAIANLKCFGGVQAGGVCNVGSPVVGGIRVDDGALNEANKFVQTPYYATVAELKELTQDLHRTSIDQILDDYAPRIQDFVDVLPVQDGEADARTHVFVRIAKGTRDLTDEGRNAYERAEQSFKKMKAELLAASKASRGKPSFMTPADKALGDKIRERLYNEARRDWVESVNKFVMEKINYKVAREVDYEKVPSPQPALTGVPRDDSHSGKKLGVKPAGRTGGQTLGTERVLVPRVNQMQAQPGPNGTVTGAIYDSYAPDAILMDDQIPSPRPRSVAPDDDGPSVGDEIRENLRN